MPIKSYKVGPGVLTLGATPLDVSCQMTSCTITPTENVTTEDAVHVLCGDTLPASDTVDYTYVLDGTLLQDLSTGGVIDYTWTNAGDEVPFSYIPNSDEDAEVAGTVRVIPLAVGGDVTTRPTSDLGWAIIGTPTFTPATP
jgi:hypothetical protein